MSWNPNAEEQNDPFTAIDFALPQEEPSSDEILRVLGGKGGAGREIFTPMANPSAFPNATKTSEEARNRVNANSKETGTIAYKDASGQTVLTNMTNENLPSVKFGGAANVSTPVYDTLSKLRTAQDSPSAQALYDSLQQTVISEKTRLENEAQRFAESKVGTTSLESTLRTAEMADKADPAWYPGIGDSPITAGIRTQLGQSRSMAEKEANSFLRTNQTYNTLAKIEKDATVEMTRVRTLADRKELFQFQQDARTEEKKFFAAEKLEEAANTLSGTQVKRIKQLYEGDFDSTKPEGDKVQALRLMGKSKDKNFLEAINVPDTALPILALKGNSYATTLLAKEEAFLTGRDEKEVAAEIKKLKTDMLSPKFAENYYKIKYPDPKKFQAEFGNFNALRQGKPDEFSQKNAMLAMEFMKLKKDQDFVFNLDTWKSTDLDFNLAIKEAKRTAGGATFENVLTAFTVDKDKRELDGSLLIARLSKFRDLTNEAALKHENSLFGMPDRLAPVQMINARAGTAMTNFIKRMKPGITDLSPAHQYGLAIHNSELGKSARATWAEIMSSPIDPITGQPFDAGAR